MPLIGYIYDTQGSYAPAFNVFVVLFGSAMVVAFVMIPTRPGA